MSKVNSIKNRRGFTVVELVVAMAIIVIVSATAIGLINTQNTVHLRTTQTIEATNMAENAIECFRWAETEAKFVESYAKTGVTLSGNTSEGITVYTFEKSNMNVTIEINGNKLTFVATDIKDSNKVILEQSYTK